MGDIDRFLNDHLLDEDAAGEFDRGRLRLIRRHRSWRENFPAVGLLLDSDEERAHALAGNYATEAREVVGLWLSMLGPEPPAGTELDERAEWVAGYWDAWRRRVHCSDAYRSLVDGPEGPRERFDLVFDDLSERYCSEAVAYVREGPKRPAAPTLAARLIAPLRAVGRSIRSFFFPTVGR